MSAIRVAPLRSAMLCAALLLTAGAGAASAQAARDFTPVTDAMVQDPAPGDWLSWRRTLDGWGFSPLDQVNRDNVGQLRLVWSRALSAGSQQGTPLVYEGVMYMPNPRDVIQAIDAVTGDLLWEYRRQRPDDIDEFISPYLSEAKRNIAVYGNLIISTSADDYAYALDAATGQLAWETQILDYRVNPAHQSAGPVRSTATRLGVPRNWNRPIVMGRDTPALWASTPTGKVRRYS